MILSCYKDNKIGNFTKKLNENKYHFENKNLKVKKSVLINSPVFSLKSSFFNPNILACSDEVGNITFIDSNTKHKNAQSKSNNHSSNNTNNTLSSTEIEPRSNSFF